MTAARDVTEDSGSGAAELHFGNYRVIEQIGEGGMGRVYLARQEGTGLDRLAVVKAVRAKLLDDPEVIERFVQEARVNARLIHPNIVQVYELGDVDGLPYVAMEHVHGRSFDKVVAAARDQGEALPLEVILRVCCDLLRALDCAHNYVDELGRAHRVIHRDVKPGNVLVGFDGSVKLIDFGLAKTTTTSLQTSTGIIRGTLAYMSPEQASAQPVDERSDLFAVGCMLFELLQGRAPFDRAEVLPTLRAICDEPTPPITAQAPDDLKRVIGHLLAKRPDDRFASADEALRALSGCGEPADDATMRELLVLLFGRAASRKLPTAELERVKRASDDPSGDPTAGRVGAPRSASRRESPDDKDVSQEALADTQHATDPSSLIASRDAASADVRRRWAPWAVLLIIVVGGAAAAYWSTRGRSEPDASGSGSASATAIARARATDSGPAASADTLAAAPPVDASTVARRDAKSARATATAPPKSGQAARHRAAAARAARVRAARRAAARAAAIKAATAKAVHARAAAKAAAAKTGTAATKSPTSKTQPEAPRGQLLVRGSRRARFVVHGTRGVGTVRGVFQVTLRYRLSGTRLVVSLSSTPWAIAYVAGSTPGRTPRHGIGVDAGGRRVELRHPDGRSMLLQLSYQARR